MRPDAPTRHLSHVPIRVVEIHAPPTPLPVYSTRDLHPVLLKPFLPLVYIPSFMHRQAEMLSQLCLVLAAAGALIVAVGEDAVTQVFRWSVAGDETFGGAFGG